MKETVVLCLWDIDKRELDVSTEAFRQFKFCHCREFERHELIVRHLGQVFQTLYSGKI